MSSSSSTASEAVVVEAAAAADVVVEEASEIVSAPNFMSPLMSLLVFATILVVTASTASMASISAEDGKTMKRLFPKDGITQ